MKSLRYIIFISYLFCSLALSQAFRVTNIQGVESLDPPVMDIQGTTVRIIHNTNFWFYNFPVTGPVAPIPTTNAIHPRSIGNGPLNTIMRGNGSQVFISYIIFEPVTGNEGYRIEYVMSSDGGATWSNYDILDKITQGYTGLNLYNDNIILERSEKGNLYYLWRNQQKPDTNRISMAISVNGGVSFGTKTFVPVGDTINPAKGMSLKLMTLAGTDNLFLSYSRDTSLYFVRSTNEGATFGTPVKILSVGTGGRISSTNLVGLTNGTMYLSYGYWKSHMGMPPVMDMGTILMKSTNFGAAWTTLDTIDSRESPLYNLLLTGTGTLVTVNATSSNIWLTSSKDGIHWADSVRVNPSVNTATGKWNFGISSCLVDNNTIAIAWIDTTTGHDEIYYRTMAIPTPPAVGSADGHSPAPIQFALFQNYPNPFNPSTTIEYSIRRQSFVTIRVFDILGREVAVLMYEKKDAGRYSIEWDATALPSGVYFYRIQTEQFTETKQMILMK